MAETQINTTQISKFDYTYVQSTPATIWSIVHNLNKFPKVSIADSTGDVVYGDINHTNKNSLVILFSESVSGQASIS